MDCTRIAESLERRLGLGTKPILRRALYQRLQELCEHEGERAYLVVASVLADAESGRKDDKGRYFASVVLRRLMERRVIPMPVI